MVIHKSWDIYRKTDLVDNQSIASNYHHQASWVYQGYSITIILLVSFMLGYFVVNYQSIIKIFQYEFSSRFGNINSTLQQQMGVIAEADIFSPDNNNQLIIPKINLKAQISWDIPNDNLKEQSNNRLAHLADSAKPNQDSGTIVLFGKSSAPSWKQTPYGNVFTLLNYLDKEDRININFEDNYYVYTVLDKKIIKSAQLVSLIYDWQNQSNQLVLITNWPLGTSINKLIISAKLTSTSQKD